MDGTAAAFAAFVFAHAGCAGETDEARLDEDNLACRCRGCGEYRVFGPASVRGDGPG